MMYRLVRFSDFIQLIDDKGNVFSVPNDPANADRQAYEAWLALGNTPLEPEA